MATQSRPAPGDLVYRHRLPTRVWHWINAATVVVMLMSGLMIFNAHPRLYWGKAGANSDRAWLEIGSTNTAGLLVIGGTSFRTTGVLGRWTAPDGSTQTRAFPWWTTIPSRYDLAGARRVHLFFAWLLVLPGLGYWLWSLAGGHLRQNLLPTRAQLAPRHIWQDIRDHARLRFPTGTAALSYNILQKLSYVGVVFVTLPLLVLTGLAMSPGTVPAWSWLLDLFGGRQSARSIHFLAMAAMAAFILVHLAMVVLAGPVNEVRSIVTGWFRLPRARRA